MNDKVRGLVERWMRDAAHLHYRARRPGDCQERQEYIGRVIELKRCADELEQALAAPAEGADHWAMELAREIKANAEDHPEDYISKFALQWADLLAARAVAAEGAEVVLLQYRYFLDDKWSPWMRAADMLEPSNPHLKIQTRRLIVHPEDRAATQEVES